VPISAIKFAVLSTHLTTKKITEMFRVLRIPKYKAAAAVLTANLYNSFDDIEESTAGEKHCSPVPRKFNVHLCYKLEDGDANLTFNGEYKLDMTSYEKSRVRDCFGDATFGHDFAPSRLGQTYT
jgi:hypothetical protein